MHDIKIAPGNSSLDRLLAAIIDAFLGLGLGLLAAVAIPNDQVVLRAAALIVAYLAYFFLFEAIIGSTPGKLMFGLWVRRLEGGPCSWKQAAVRTLARVVEVNPFFLAAIPSGIAILASSHRQRFGDLLAGTTVRKGRSA